MSACLFSEFVGPIVGQPIGCLLVGQSCLGAGAILFLELLECDFMVFHEFEFFCQLYGLIEGCFLFNSCSDFLGSVLDGFLELEEVVLVGVQFQVLLGFDEGSDELAACLAH